MSYPSEFALNLATCLLGFFLVFHQINLGIALFNLIPVPPLDGSRILNVLLPERIYFGIMKYERIIYWVLIGWLFLGGRAAALLLAVPVVAANPVLSALCYVLDLSGMLGDLITCVSGLMFSFWKLLPFLA